MFKKVLFVAALILFTNTVPASAQTRKNLDLNSKTSSSSGLERAREASGKSLLPEVRQKNIRSLFERMLSKFEAAITRVEGLIEKIERRLLSLSETKPDVDLSILEQDLASAKEYVESAKVGLENAKIQLENVVLSETPGEEFKELRLLISEVKDDLQSAHRLFVKIITNLKRAEGVSL